jgi:hypothetical protein
VALAGPSRIMPQYGMRGDESVAAFPILPSRTTAGVTKCTFALCRWRFRAVHHFWFLHSTILSRF